MKNFKWSLMFFLLISQTEIIAQNYYSTSELDQPPVYGNSNTEFLQDILASCKFISNNNCQSGNYEIQFDVIVSMQENRSILAPAQPVKVEQVIFRSDLCEEFRNQIKTSILILNNDNKWSSGYINKRKRLKVNIPYSKIELNGNSVYSVPSMLPLSLSIDVKKNNQKTDTPQINYTNEAKFNVDAALAVADKFKEEEQILPNKNQQTNNNNSPKEINQEANNVNEADSSVTSTETTTSHENNGVSSNIGLLIFFAGIGLILISVVVIILLKRKNKEKSRIKAEEEFKIKAEKDARLQYEKEEARINAEKEEAKRKADEQSRIKAEQDAKLKAEEDARIKAEKEEAKRKAEELGRIKAEQDAKLKAEEEAEKEVEKEEEKRKAEEQARIKAEKEVKRKSEEEARIKAEKEEAKRKVEEQARIELENNSYYYEIIENESVVIKGPFNFKQMEKLLQKNEISLLTKVKFGLNKKTLKPLKEFKEFTTGLEDFL